MIRAVVCALVVFALPMSADADVPRPEHPTPDAVRPHWASLNGAWQFRLDPNDQGQKAGWEKSNGDGFDQTIIVPFPWESELSRIHRPDYHGIAWYRRAVTLPESFPKGQRIWLHFGAVDWRADVWVNGRHVAKHEGGYTPFQADITDAVKLTEGKPSVVTVRVFDPTDPSQPTGKQVGWYTTTSGIWQTVWLESRPKAHIDRWTVKTDIDPAKATFNVALAGIAPGKYRVSVRSDDASVKPAEASIEVKEDMLCCTDEDAGMAGPTVKVEVPISNAKIWTPESPHLYDVTLSLKAPDGQIDEVKTYFGLRTIARGRYGDAPYERILLNGKPVYLRAALDQSFNPKGIYTAPDDEFLKRDLFIAKSMGLNGLRIHIKPDEPRRLYWVDRIGLLILEDMPNTWRQNAEARAGWEKTMREAVVRDRNHPAIVTWVAFNETWGLGTPERYKKDVDTQQWVGRMVAAIRKLDPTRLVEDNSPCNYDHVENTDLNSWHFYIDDHSGAKKHIDEVVAKTEPGNVFNYCPGQKQGTAPLINSEYGGVSAGGGDRDISWCFRDLTTLLRKQPKIQGYVYTELSDIEWEHNGFVNYDRSPKTFGYDAFLPDMRPNELNFADFIGYDGPPALVVKPGERVTVPAFVSHFSDRKGPLFVRWWVAGWDDNADLLTVVPPTSVPAVLAEYDVKAQEPVIFTAPDRPFIGAVLLTLREENNDRIAANYVNLVVRPAAPLPRAERNPKDDHEAILRFSPAGIARRHFSGGAANPRGKAYGRGKGFLEYHIKVPASVVKAKPESYFLRFEAASKAGREKVDWPERANPQDYPQTDARKWPSTVAVSLGDVVIDRQELEDDPADARGVLAHLTHLEHGSHGELIEATGKIPGSVRLALAAGKPLILRFAVPDDAKHAGGLCLFGAESGQFPLDPTLVIRTTEALPSDLGVKASDPVAVDRMAERRSIVLASGESATPAVWAYNVSDQPEAGWNQPSFNDSAWSRGKAGFGSTGTPAVAIGTPWTTRRISLRTMVELPTLGPDDSLTLRIFHDEDADVFVNGKPLVKTRGFIAAYREIELDSAQRSLFQPGPNTLAVSCRQTRGGQGIDLGLVLQRGE
jgi:hypothetical protein